MKKTYDSEQAQRLIPLLEVIGREISERTEAIARLKTLRGRPDTQPAERLQIRAELSTHRRELNRARRELEALGCRQAEGEPTAICIPGLDGAFEGGHLWVAGDGTFYTGVHVETSEATGQ